VQKTWINKLIVLVVAILVLSGCDAIEILRTSAWEEVSPEQMGMKAGELQKAIDYAGGSGYITRGGKLVMKWGSAAKRYDLKSTTKSIGVTALGLAIKDGKVNLSDKGKQYVSNLGVPPNGNKDTGWVDDITLFHLATHTAGFDKRGGYTSLLFEPGTIGSSHLLALILQTLPGVKMRIGKTQLMA